MGESSPHMAPLNGPDFWHPKNRFRTCPVRLLAMIHHEKTRVLSLIHHHQRLAIVVTILLSFLGVILAIVVINYYILGVIQSYHPFFHRCSPQAGHIGAQNQTLVPQMCWVCVGIQGDLPL